MEFERTFVFERDTKRMHVFQEVAEAGKPMAVGSIYIKKDMFETMPEKIVVKVTA